MTTIISALATSLSFSPHGFDKFPGDSRDNNARQILAPEVVVSWWGSVLRQLGCYPWYVQLLYCEQGRNQAPYLTVYTFCVSILV